MAAFLLSFGYVPPETAQSQILPASTKTEWPNVRIDSGRYYYVKNHKWTALTRIDEGEPAMLRALARVKSPSAATVRDMLEAYIGFGMERLAKATQKSYLSNRKPILKVFGNVPPNEVTSGHIAQYLEKRLRQDKAVAGNREIALLSSAYNYGQRNGLCAGNPCYGVRRNPEQPRTRYIDDDEFLLAFNKAPERVQDLLAIAYLTGLRQKDVRELKRSQITPKGILIQESKTGKRLTVEITEALRYFLLRAQSRSESEYVLTNKRGQPWGEWAIQSVMRRLGVDWTFHDLRGKAESDHKTGMGLMPLYKRARTVSPVR